MTGGIEVTVLALRMAVVIGLYTFLALVLVVIWRGYHSGDQTTGGTVTSSGARLVVVEPAASGLEMGAEFELSASGTIGREAPNTIILPDAGVSARHGRIAFRHGGWWIEDLQSANGTYVNAIRIEAPTLLADGDELEVAQVRLRLEIA